MRSRLPVLAAMLAAGCQGTIGEGTSVGNPSPTSVEVAGSTARTARSGRLSVESVVTTDCDGTPTVTVHNAVFDPTASALIAVPPGTWCAIDLVLDAPFQLDGTNSGGSFHLDLDLPEVQLVSAGLEVQGTALVLELAEPGWLADLPDGDVTVDAAHPLHEDLAKMVALRSGLYVDADGNLSLDDDERTDALATGVERTKDDDESGS